MDVALFRVTARTNPAGTRAARVLLALALAACGRAPSSRPHHHHRARSPSVVVQAPRPGEVRNLPSGSGMLQPIVRASEVAARGSTALIGASDAILRIDDDATQAIVVAPVVRRVTSIAITEDHAIWTEASSLGARAPDGVLVRASLPSGDREVLEVSVSPDDLVAEGEDLFFVSGPIENRVVRRMHADGSGATVLASGPALHSVAVDRTNVYFVRGNAIVAVPRAGGDERTVSPDSSDGSPTGLAADERGLYAAFRFVDGSGGVRFSARGTTTMTAVFRAPFVPIDLALVPDRVLVLGSFDGVVSVPERGGEPTPLERQMRYGRALAATDHFVWVVDGDPSDAFRIPR